MCKTAHATINKAASMLGMKVVFVPYIKNTYQMDYKQIEKVITKNTTMIIASAPSYL